MLYLFFVLLAPFILTIILPSFIIPFLSKILISRKKTGKIYSIKLFVLLLIFGGVIASVLWYFLIQKNLYYTWDTLSMFHYSFFGFPHPSFTSFGWLAEGWKIWHLDLLHTVLTTLVYVGAALVAWKKTKKTHKTAQFKQVLFTSVIGLFVITIILPRNILKYFQLSNIFKRVTLKENDTPCSESPYDEPRILYSYNAENGEITQDLHGENQEIAFKKDLQIRNNKVIFSPDKTKVAALSVSWNEYWIMCTYSEGVKKITLPLVKENNLYLPKSKPSWSPDGKKLALNLHGDIVVINIDTKEFEVVIKDVGLRDNHVDVTSKDRNKSIPAYEIGAVYWSRDGILYYILIKEDIYILRKYDFSNQSDEVVTVYESREKATILSGDPTGRYLLLNVKTLNNDRSPVMYSGMNMIFDTKTKKYTRILKENSIPNVVWSPSGKYFIKNEVNWTSKQGGGYFVDKTYIRNVNSNIVIDITELVEDFFGKEGKIFEPESVSVKVVGFIDEEQVVAHVQFSDNYEGNGFAFANIIVNFKTKEVTLLPSYTEGKDGQGQPANKRITPRVVLP